LTPVDGAGLVDETLARPLPARRHLSLEQLLAWAYRDQRAHDYLRSESDWFLWQSEQMGIEMAPRDTRPLHPDAAIIHYAVMEEVRRVRRALRVARFKGKNFGALTLELNAAEQQAAIIIDFARRGERAEYCTTEPTPRPTIAPNRRDYDYCRGTVGGELVDILVLTAEVVSVETEEWVVHGRKKLRRVAAGRQRVEITYCPLEWWPDPSFVEMANHIAAAWEAALASLKRRLAGVAFKNHALVEE
jgi:hypothetical protein